ncbi:MAG: VWA domain-containing protein [Thiomargarita sp.]|nr:VWA domain-containing protein [Thiomargarita sp.]
MNLHKLLYSVFITAFLYSFLNTTINAGEFKLDTTENNIPKKALIIKHDAKLFKSPYRLQRTAKKASFLQLYFLMTPEKHNRVPVLEKYSKTKTKPDMWLEKDSYVEWNTIQMINFTPQKGRKRINIYASKKCAKTYARFGKTTEECQVLGEEGPLFDKQQYKLLIPVFQQDQDNYYHGGFIRISQGESYEKQGPLGYDLILVVDSSLSMGKYFRPTMEVLQTFVKLMKESTQAEVVIPLRIGLLFYRDRKGNDCDLGYVTQWAQHLTSDVQKVIQALNHAKATDCNSLNNQEAVWDGINRAIVDTVWHKNNLQTIILIGDAPPYSENDIENNPMQFSIAYLHDKAKKGKNIRFLTFKIGEQDNQNSKPFKNLALATEEALKGRFHFVAKADILQFQQELREVLVKEWGIAEKTGALYTKKSSPLDISKYEYPIILAHIERSKAERDFVKGWVPKKISNKLAFGEYIFMRKMDLAITIHTIEGIILAAENGIKEGPDAFLDMVRNTLATQVKMKFYQLFEEGETLEKILKKADILPFKTQILSFNAREVNTWKPVDYQNITVSLKEKVRYLREFSGNPKNERRINETAYLYVPRKYFP